MKRTAIVLGLFLCGTACASTSKSYVDTSYGKIQYSDIVKPAQPYKLKLKVEFQRNGQHLPAVDSQLMQQVDSVVRASGFAAPVGDSESGSDSLTIVVNNIADLAEARKKGFATGSTFFLKGTVVTDNYEMQATATIGGKTVSKSGYKGAILTAIGHASGPEGVPPMNVTEAFNKVVEQLILQFLRDLPTTELNPSLAPVPSASQLNPQSAVAPQSSYDSAPVGMASLIVRSTPDGADILLDGKFAGNTPSTVRIKAGDHTVRIELKGFTAWEKSLTVSADAQITLNANLSQ
jgi:PEGA domain